MDRKTGNAKGSIFINTREYIEKYFGDSVWKLILVSLPGTDGKFYEMDIQKTEWYPVPFLNRLINTYDMIIGKGDFLSVVPISEYIAKKDLGPVFEVFLDLKNPQVILNSAPTLWSRYFDSGRMEIETLDMDNRVCTLNLYEIADETIAPGIAICNFAVPEWFRMGLMLSGASTVTITQSECRYKGAETCKFEVRWEYEPE